MKYLKGELKFKEVEEVLWLDIETTPIEKEITEESTYWNAWCNKVKYDDKIGDTNEEIIKVYSEKAGLYREFSKIVSVSYGIVRNGKLKVKNIVGEEVDILNTLFADIDSFRAKGGVRFLGVFSGKQFDIPFIHYRAIVNRITPNEFLDTGGIAPWQVKHVIDVQDILRGGGMTNLSLDGVCASFGIPSPKEGEAVASNVRDMYYSGNIKAISEYNNRDVLATCNAFLHYLNEEYVEMEIVGQSEAEKPTKEYETLLHELYDHKMFNEEFQGRLKKQLKKNKFKKTEAQQLRLLLESTLFEKIEIGDKDTKMKQQLNEERLGLIDNFMATL